MGCLFGGKFPIIHIFYREDREKRKWAVGRGKARCRKRQHKNRRWGRRFLCFCNEGEKKKKSEKGVWIFQCLLKDKTREGEESSKKNDVEFFSLFIGDCGGGGGIDLMVS